MSVVPSRRPGLSWRIGVALSALLAIALLARLDGLGTRTLSHPENFVPGLDVPDWVSFPPERKDLVSILRGTLVDGHPPAYFVAMLGWVKLAGTSVFALRLPSAIAGALTVGLVFLLARRLANERVALVAALLVALHGYHVYWSQLARMYAPVACLGVLSTWLLLRARASMRRSDETAYVVAITSALWMQIYAWPLLLGQIVWIVWDALRNARPARMLTAQGLAVVLGLPVVQLAIYQNPGTRWLESTQGWWQLGYLYSDKVPLLVEPPAIVDTLRSVALVLGVLVLAHALIRPGSKPEPIHEGAPCSHFGRRTIWGSGLAIAACMTLFPLLVTWGSAAPRVLLWACVGLPLMGAALLGPVQRGTDALATRGVFRWLPRLALAPCLTVVPTITMVALSIARPVFVGRGTTVFLPYYSVCCALGIEACGSRKRSLGIAAFVVFVALHAGSLFYFRGAVATPREYRELAERLTAQLAPDDLILVRDNYVYPPLFYYLHADDQLVHADHAERVELSDGRVWLVRFDENPLSPGVLAAVEGRELVETIEVRGGAADLYAAR